MKQPWPSFRLISLTVSIVLVSSLLGACDGAQNDTSTRKVVEVVEQQSEPANAKPVTDTNPDADYPKQVFFGDTHLHTSNSGDAFAYGARLTPDSAYRFAKGETVVSNKGQDAKLSKPLDFLVVADHAEGLGILQSLADGNATLLKDPQLARWAQMLNADAKQAHLATQEIIRGLADKTLPPIISDPAQAAPFAKSLWAKYVATADKHNQPGVFTSLIGYEYTSQPNGNNLHRVVVFRDGAERTSQVLPFSSTISNNPEDLWAALQKYEDKTGGKALAIPHNPNLSNGHMFAMADFEGGAIDSDYATKRARWEPIVEATQIKGDSESHPLLSPNDEYASYGDSGWEQGNLTLQTSKTAEMLAGDYTREALKRGLLLEQQVGVNPFKFGMIGSTDSHTGLATADEDNFFGKNVQMEPGAKRTSKIFKQAEAGTIYGWQYLAGGYAAVWAKQNTRESLFDAMLKKEVYTTTGPRIRLRFFGSFNFSQKMSEQADIAKSGYELGVPMGGDLSGAGQDEAPGFLIRALKDPEGENLARLQVIKGWLKPDGTLKEQVYDVKSSQQTDGDAELSQFWQDPSFDSSMSAFYYVRVLETPSYRWPVMDASVYEVDVPDQARAAVQERAYSSPIWYTPSE